MKNLLLVVALFVSCFTNVHAHDDDCSSKTPSRSIQVSGSAVASSQPDLATINFNIKTEDVEIKRAREENARIAAEVLNSIRKLEIPEADINMLNLTINEENEWDPKTHKSIFKGYLAQRNFKIQIKKSNLNSKTSLSEKVAQVVTAIVETGTNQLDSVSYGLVDDKALSNQALEKAILNAKEKALLMLSPLGAQLGPVINVTESNTSRPVPYLRSMSKLAYAMEDSSAIPEPDSFSEGDIEVTASVNLVFEIQ